MVKTDEKELIALLRHKGTKERFPSVRQAVREVDMNEKRAAYVLDKWADKGWYDYGVSVMAGWLTAEGLSALL